MVLSILPHMKAERASRAESPGTPTTAASWMTPVELAKRWAMRNAGMPKSVVVQSPSQMRTETPTATAWMKTERSVRHLNTQLRAAKKAPPPQTQKTSQPKKEPNSVAPKLRNASGSQGVDARQQKSPKKNPEAMAEYVD
jgi:hypothetical protein